MLRRWRWIVWIGLLAFWLGEGTAWPEAFEAQGLGARALGMGGAFIGMADDWTAIYWNPAGLARLQGLHAGFNLLSPRFNDYDGDSVHNFDPDNFRLQQGDVFPRLHPSEPSRFNEKWSNNFAINPSFAVILGSTPGTESAGGPDPSRPAGIGKRLVEGWTLAAGVHSPIGNLLSWDDLVRDPATGAWITADYQAFMAIVNLQLTASRELFSGLYVGLGGNLVYTGSKLRAVKYYTGSADPSRPDYRFKFKTRAWDLRPEGVLSLLYQPHPRFSLGAVYRTGTTMDLEGRARIGNTLQHVRESSRYAQEVLIPATYGVGLCFRIAPDWLATADWQGTNWSPMRAKLHFERPGRGLVPLREDLHWKRSRPPSLRHRIPPLPGLAPPRGLFLQQPLPARRDQWSDHHRGRSPPHPLPGGQPRVGRLEAGFRPDLPLWGEERRGRQAPLRCPPVDPLPRAALLSRGDGD